MEKELIFSASKKDFRIDKYKGSGPGGQHRNKTESCIRIVHLATGITTSCCSEKSQHTNKKLAFRAMVEKLVDHYTRQDQKQRYAAGNERVRTYHEPDDRVTCHKSGKQFSYKETVGKNDIEKLINQRVEALLLDMPIE